MQINPKTYDVFLGTEIGIYSSKNFGKSYSLIGLEGKNVQCLAFDSSDPSYIYAGTFSYGLFKSDDSGTTWKQLGTDIQKRSVFDVEFDPKDSQKIYIATDNGVYASSNGGETWRAMSSGINELWLLSMEIDPTNAKVMYAGSRGGGVYETESGVYFVENYGTTWEKLQGGGAPSMVHTCLFDPNDWSTIYAGTYEDGFFKKQISRKVTVTSTEGGTVSPSGVVEIPFGGWITFTITLKEGYKVKELYLGTRRFDPYTSFKVTDIALNTSFNAVFDKVAVETKSKVIILQIGNMNFTVDGVKNTLDLPPVIKKGRTLIPIRAVVEALGGTIGWDSTTKKVTVTLKDTSIELRIGKPQATVNGQTKWIDDTNHKVMPEIISGRTMLPVRFVIENLGAHLDWDGTTKTITITYPAP